MPLAAALHPAPASAPPIPPELAPTDPARLGRSEQARLNGARSRGPVTPEGKARSSRNALKHGLAAAIHVAPTEEDAAELAALEEGLAAELAPESLLEAFLVARLAAAMWKMQRADRMEARALAPGTDAPERPDLGLALRYQAAAGRGFHTSLREFRRLRRQPIFVPAAVRAHVRSAAPARPNEPETASATRTSARPGPTVAARNEPEPPASGTAPPARPNEPEPRPAVSRARPPNEPEPATGDAAATARNEPDATAGGRPPEPAPPARGPQPPPGPRSPHATRPPPHPPRRHGCEARVMAALLRRSTSLVRPDGTLSR